MWAKLTSSRGVTKTSSMEKDRNRMCGAVGDSFSNPSRVASQGYIIHSRFSSDRGGPIPDA